MGGFGIIVDFCGWFGEFGDEETVVFGAQDIKCFCGFDDFDILVLEFGDNILEVGAMFDVGAQKSTTDKIWLGF